MTKNVLGVRFNLRHEAEVTRYQVDRAHRSAGYYECVAIRGVSGTHHFIGSIQVFSRADIERALDEEVEDEGLAWAAAGEAARHPREYW